VDESVLLLFNWLRLSHGDGRCAVVYRLRGRFSRPLNTLPYEFGDWFINGAGVGFLFCDAELRQHFEDHMRGNLELPG
jgi:hypothetical protein